MKITLDWLKRHLETDATLDDIVATLNRIGLEVEEVEDRTAELAPFTVGYVVKAEQHPNADRLRVCVVETGKGEVQVVCGAPNARTGMKGVFAPSGSHIPGTGVDLKESEIRGVASRGMLCSEREMGLSDEHDGIIDLPEDAEIGASYAAMAGLDDPVLDIGLTPDRGDCFSVRGIARDLAAAGLGTLKPLDTSPV
ncbi:MAG: phenylalanine--tRNA ligase subunit beta, partial [Rhodospirillaceae bacterium]|nr:phenylalanine--tRNA ligase subunit beta [Rhodospirillaceae bacterium]